MQEVFEKILDRLEDGVSIQKMNGMERRVGKRQTQGFGLGVRFAKEIVQEVAEEYKDGWIPCSERLPEEPGLYLVCYENEKCYPNIIFTYGKFIEEEHILAWQPLPESYKEVNREKTKE